MKHLPTASRFPFRTWTAIGAAVIGLTLAGCVAPDAAVSRISAFSDAAMLATDNTKSAYDTAERKYYDVQVLRSVVKYDTDGFQPDKFRTLFSPESRQARQLVLNGLSLYAQKLAALMGNEQLGQFDEATRKLGTDLGSLSTSIGTAIGNTRTAEQKQLLDGHEIRVLTTAVNSLGNWFLRAKREKGVRAIVAEMDPHIGSITTALARDIASLRKVVANQYVMLQVAEDKYIRDSRFEPAAKRQAIGALARLVTEARDADATYAAMEQSITTLRRAHGHLLDVFTQNRVEIDSLIRELTGEAKRVKAFYDSVARN